MRAYITCWCGARIALRTIRREDVIDGHAAGWIGQARCTTHRSNCDCCDTDVEDWQDLEMPYERSRWAAAQTIRRMYRDKVWEYRVY
jgi:hypothetical protein